MSNDKTVMDLTSVEGIQVALESCKDSVMKGVLEALLKAKQREIELAAKAKTSTKKSAFTVGESIAKALFVALRPHVADDGIALKAYKAGIATLTDDDNIDVDLQEKIFSSSTLHCSKSNFNKCTDITTAYNSYIAITKQAKILLPDISENKWSEWLKAVGNAAKTVAKKRNITWNVPTDKQTEPVQDDKTEAVQDDKTEAVPTKTVITTRKNGKKK